MNYIIHFRSIILASSSSDIYEPQTPRSRTKENTVNTSPNPDEEGRKRKSQSYPEEITEGEDIPKEIYDRMFPFQKKQKKHGTIDVWWLYDDGGKIFLYIINK